MPDPAVTDAAGHRSRWFRRPWILVLGVVVLMGAVAFTISESARLFVYLATEICIYGVPSDEDVHEAAAVKGTIPLLTILLGIRSCSLIHHLFRAIPVRE